MRLDPRHRGRDRKAEIGIGAEARVAKRAVERTGHERSRRLDRHPPSDPVDAAGPARIDQPAVDLVVVDVFAHEVAVFPRRPRQERRRKAGREFRLDADQALLGAGDLGGVAGKEMIHRLRRRELRDRRHHAECVGGEKDDVLGVSAASAL